MQYEKIFKCQKCGKRWDGYGGKFLNHGIIFCEDCWRSFTKNQRNYQYKKAKKRSKGNV